MLLSIVPAGILMLTVSGVAGVALLMKVLKVLLKAPGHIMRSVKMSNSGATA